MSFFNEIIVLKNVFLSSQMFAQESENDQVKHIIEYLSLQLLLQSLLIEKLCH